MNGINIEFAEQVAFFNTVALFKKKLPFKSLYYEYYQFFHNISQ